MRKSQVVTALLTHTLSLSLALSLFACGGAEDASTSVDIAQEEELDVAASLTFRNCTITTDTPILTASGKIARGSYSCGTSPYIRQISIWLRRDGTDLGGTEQTACEGTGSGSNVVNSWGSSTTGNTWKSCLQVLRFIGTGCTSSILEHSGVICSVGVSL